MHRVLLIALTDWAVNSVITF